MESIKGIMTKLNASLKAMSPGQKIILFLVSAFIFSGFCVMILWSNQEEHSILFSNLSMQDAGAIVEKLKEQKIPYEISGDGSIIRVPAAVVYETRLSLASQGLPRGGGVGFEIFDKSSIGTTDFVLRLNYRRALQGELARTISQFQEIEGARVHLVIPRRSPFFSEEEKARASVAIRLRPGASLARGQVQGIVHLVASSVEALQPSSVTVVDTHGKILSGSPPLSDPVFLSNSQIEYRRGVEKDIERRIESMLEKVLGPGKAIARASATIDFKRIEKVEERYDPDTVAIRSEQRMEEKHLGSTAKAEGVPGALSNLPSGQKSSGTTGTGSKNTSLRNNETINYEVSLTRSSVVEPSGSIKKLSVAVLLDGYYKKVTGEDGVKTLTYVPRTSEEMKKYEEIVKKAIGFDAERGDQVEVQNIPFERIDIGEEEIRAISGAGLREFLPLIRYAGTAILTLLFLLLVVKPLLKGLLTIRPAGSDVEVGALSDPALPEGEVRKALVSQKNKETELIEMAKKDPDGFAGYIRNWLSS